jgi:hypothetical protein
MTSIGLEFIVGADYPRMVLRPLIVVAFGFHPSRRRYVVFSSLFTYRARDFRVHGSPQHMLRFWLCKR